MSNWTREAWIAATLLAFGVLALPPAIYLVGQQLFGPYDAGGGLAALVDRIWLDLTQGEPAAWLLVLSPYVVIQLGRLSLRLFRGRRSREPDHSSGS
jgi:hypothetical protein